MKEVERRLLEQVEAQWGRELNELREAGQLRVRLPWLVALLDWANEIEIVRKHDAQAAESVAFHQEKQALELSLASARALRLEQENQELARCNAELRRELDKAHAALASIEAGTDLRAWISVEAINRIASVGGSVPAPAQRLMCDP